MPETRFPSSPRSMRPRISWCAHLPEVVSTSIRAMRTVGKRERNELLEWLSRSRENRTLAESQEVLGRMATRVGRCHCSMP